MQTQTTKAAPVIVHCPCCRYGCTAQTCEAAYQAIAAHIVAKHPPMSAEDPAVTLWRAASGRVQ